MSEKIYTQEDMDNIVSKVKSKQEAKYEKTHISLTEYNKLQEQYNQLLEQNKVNNFKEQYMNHGGNPEAYNDFIASNKEIVSLEGEKLEAEFVKLRESKPFYFNSKQPPHENQVTAPSDNDIVKELYQEDNSHLIEGTIYKKQF